MGSGVGVAEGWRRRVEEDGWGRRGWDEGGGRRGGRRGRAGWLSLKESNDEADGRRQLDAGVREAAGEGFAHGDDLDGEGAVAHV